MIKQKYTPKSVIVETSPVLPHVHRKLCHAQTNAHQQRQPPFQLGLGICSDTG